MSASFKGGIHPRYAKELSSGAAIEELPPPDVAIVHLNQHIGAPAKAVVDKKAQVLVGQQIGEASGFVSVPIHAPISGTVKDIGLYPHPFGLLQEAVVIEADGEDKWIDLPKEQNPAKLSADEIKERIRSAGIVGLGGAAFPTHVKLSPPPAKSIDSVLLNAAECEPYLTADDRLMQEEPDRVISGFLAVMKVLGAKTGIVGIEENKPEAIKAMERAAGKAGGVRVAGLHVKYPQGGEKQLIDALLGREVPTGGLPMDCGVVVQNVATCAAVDDAVRYGRPLISRVTTVTGEGVNQPVNVRGRVGTPVKTYIERAGGYKGTPGRVILGGPMMGGAVHNTDVPVIKATGGVLVLQQEQLASGEFEACIRCGRCVGACPIRLCPNEMGNYSEVELWDEVNALDVNDCIECGCCAFSCPANRPLVQFFRYAKLWNRQQQALAKAAESKGSN
ncbi:MAG: electron transport complex subunit RsxC [bacterium]